MAGALAVHTAPFLFAVWWPGPTSPLRPAVSDPIIYVDLAPRLASPVPPSERPPGPEQVQAEAPRPKAVRAPDKPPAEIPPLVLPAAPPEPVREPARDLAPETTAPPSRPAPPAPRPTSGQTTWQGQVLAALDRKKRFPRAAQARREQGVPYIRFVIDREGRVLSSRLERSSGFRSLDDEAVALPKRAQPLPAPPADVVGATIELVAPVEFFIR
ncbi:MAG: TonB family protein [Phenylobacterium sp.]